MSGHLELFDFLLKLQITTINADNTIVPIRENSKESIMERQRLSYLVFKLANKESNKYFSTTRKCSPFRASI
eukprot:m.236377 g.236377  ORF g.236377 m.236377 type:complete len:72 (-) comp16047_c1_seq3:119-334(-)